MRKIKILSIIMLSIILGVLIVGVIKQKQINHQNRMASNNETSENQSSNREITNIEISEQNITETAGDESAIVAEEDSVVTISNSTIEKTGDTTDLGESDKRGLNAAIKATQLSEIILQNTKVTTNGKGASGAAAVGLRAILTINDVEIYTGAERSKGILSTRRGMITANNIKIETIGYKSSAIATDMGGGTIEVKNAEVKTNNIDSVGVYATGKVTVEDSKMISEQAEGVCIDGSGEVILNNVEMIANKKRGAMLYYTGPSRETLTTGRFYMTGGSLTVNEGPAFYVMNSGGEIELENVNITSNSGIFLQASVDELGELGQEGAPVVSKGGEVTVRARNQQINGDIVVDSESTAEIILQEGSNIVGSIDNKNTGKIVNVVLEDGCTWTLTGNSYVSSLQVTDEKTQINLNGYKIYYKNQ